MTLQPGQWITEQNRLARSMYLIFDSEAARETRQALLTVEPTPRNISVYNQTPVSDVPTGPLILQVNNALRPVLSSLLETPERNWGWLVSCEGDQLTNLADHWRARIIIGQRPNQALYRFQDNRVLTRALNHLTPETLPEYLGPICSALYWNGQDWATVENPAPGIYSVPESPAWLSVPAPAVQSRAILHKNIARYLIEEHAEAISDLAADVNVSEWLTAQLDIADEWNWKTPEQLQFLIDQRLKEEKGRVIQSWLSEEGETPQLHFERLYKEAKYWAGEA